MSVKSFATFEEMQNYMTKGHAAAEAVVTPEQAAIGYDDCWLRVVPEYDKLWIFGWVWPLEYCAASSASLTTDLHEIAEETAMIEDAHARHYRFGEAYSVIEPRGEIGSTHVVSMTPLPVEMFDQARAHGWDIQAILDDTELTDEDLGAWLRIVRTAVAQANTGWR